MVALIVTGGWIVLFGGTCAVIAESRGRRAGVWFVLGAVFGIFALVAVCAMPAFSLVIDGDWSSSPLPRRLTDWEERHRHVKPFKAID